MIDSRAELNFLPEFVDVDGMHRLAAVVSDNGEAYVGGTAGVEAKIYYHDHGCSRSGDLTFNPDGSAKGKSANARKLVFHFPENGIGLPAGGAPSSVFLNFRMIMQLGSSKTDAKIAEKRGAESEEAQAHPALSDDRPLPIILQTNFDGCESLRFENIRLTRTNGFFEHESDGLYGVWSANAGKLGAWSAESLPTDIDVDDDGLTERGHWARCRIAVGGRGHEASGDWMDMPFKVLVSEIRLQ